MELIVLSCLALVAGVLSFSSPCVLPLLPGYASYVSGLARGDEGAAAAGGRRAVLAGSLLFVFGFAVVFTALGAASSALGPLLVRNQRTLELLAGVLIVLMGLAMTGLLRPRFLWRELRMDPSRIGRGPAGAPALGAAFAFSWTPCVGPVLGSILAIAASSGTVARGALLLFVYSLGLGIPFLLLARGLARGQVRFGWLRRHGRRMEIVGGAVLAVMGLAIATGLWTIAMSGLLAAFARLGWPPI